MKMDTIFWDEGSSLLDHWIGLLHGKVKKKIRVSANYTSLSNMQSQGLIAAFMEENVNMTVCWWYQKDKDAPIILKMKRTIIS